MHCSGLRPRLRIGPVFIYSLSGLGLRVLVPKFGTPLDVPGDKHTVVALVTPLMRGTHTSLDPTLCKMTHIVAAMAALTSEADWCPHFRQCCFRRTGGLEPAEPCVRSSYGMDHGRSDVSRS